MTIDISVRFSFKAEEPTDVLLQFEAAPIPEQYLVRHNTMLGATEHFARIPAQDDIGDRLWVRVVDEFEAGYDASVELKRLNHELGDLAQLDTHDLPAPTVQYLFDSRYCPADKFQSFVQAEFGELKGGERVLAMHDWIADAFTYTPGSSTAETTALDSFVQRQGICRDYAHVMVTLARASGIPARFVSCFAPGVTPQDFHAVAEVFLEDRTTPGGGAWFLVDATGMGSAADIVKIGVGRDAADVSFMTSFGQTEFLGKTITVTG